MDTFTRQTVRFALLLLVILSTITFALFFLIRHAVYDEYLRTNGASTLLIVQSEARDHLTTEDFIGPNPERFEEFLLTLPIEQMFDVKVWSSNGTLIHHQYMGEVVLEPHTPGSFQDAEVEYYPEDDRVFTHVQAIEVYAPIRMEVDGEERTVGLIELYHGIEDMQTFLARLYLRAAFLLCGLFITLFLSIGYLYLITMRTVRRQQEHLAASAAQIAQQEQEISASYERLKAADALKERFFSHMNHEIRTPLTAIKAYTEFLGDGDMGPLTKKQKEGVGIIKESISNMEITINNLLDHAKMEEGKLQLAIHAVAVRGLLESTSTEMSSLAKQKGIALTTRVPRTLPDVECDEYYLRSAVRNLLSNAIKYTPKGGRVTVQAVIAENDISIIVQDTGIGIEENVIPTLFERFSATSTHGLAGEASSGLGLSIVKQIAEQHHGTISVHSVPGKGTAFTITLPLRQPHASV
jgi:signal transduction histidine kinase